MIGYVAKDKDGRIYFHEEKPDYIDKIEGWYSNYGIINITGQFPELDNISYTDDPIKVEINLTKI